MLPPKIPGLEAISSIAGPSNKGFTEFFEKISAEKAAKYAVKYKGDIEFIAGNENTGTPELIGNIRKRMEKTGSPGGSASIGLLSETAIMARQAEMLRAGCLPSVEALSAQGYPLLVDTEKTTPEMLEKGLVVPTFDARVRMLGLSNVLESSIGTYMSRTAKTKAERVAQLVRSKTLLSQMRGLMASKEPAVGEQPDLLLDSSETTKLNEILARKFINIDEAKATVSRELQNMIKLKPEIAYLDGPAQLREKMRELLVTIGGENFSKNTPLNINTLDNFRLYMRGDVMDQLNIYPGYSDAVAQGIDSDLPLSGVKRGYSLEELHNSYAENLDEEKN